MRMHNKKNILVFPCGSEIGLEIYRSLEISIHFNLIGASSVDDHGKFVFEKYISGLPFFHQENFIEIINSIISDYNIDFIYPTMDAVINFFAKNKEKFNAEIISSSFETTEICNSKEKTYETLKKIVTTPKVFDTIDEISEYPVFAKPKIGYGSRGAKRLNNKNELIQHLQEVPDCIVTEYLPGKEYTVDCFTDFLGELKFSSARERKRTMNGISVNTVSVKNNIKFQNMASLINDNIKFNGSWFFQVKENQHKEIVLMEIACRLAGSSALFRNLGVNFASLNLFNALKYKTEIFLNDFEIELDRALNNKYKTNLQYNIAYIDYDDTIVLNGNEVNTKLISLIYQFKNQNIKTVLITRHRGDLIESLSKLRLSQLFDEIIHLKNSEKKSDFIQSFNAIFIDDSFSERLDVYKNCKIPVFSLDSIESLFK